MGQQYGKVTAHSRALGRVLAGCLSLLVPLSSPTLSSPSPSSVSHTFHHLGRQNQRQTHPNAATLGNALFSFLRQTFPLGSSCTSPSLPRALSAVASEATTKTKFSDHISSLLLIPQHFLPKVISSVSMKGETKSLVKAIGFVHGNTFI